jgi:hypothetical protein
LVECFGGFPVRSRQIRRKNSVASDLWVVRARQRNDLSPVDGFSAAGRRDHNPSLDSIHPVLVP